MDRGPPGSSVHGILQARILEWVAMPSSRGSSWPRDQTQVSFISCIGLALAPPAAPVLTFVWDIDITVASMPQVLWFPSPSTPAPTKTWRVNSSFKFSRYTVYVRGFYKHMSSCQFLKKISKSNCYNTGLLLLSKSLKEEKHCWLE